MNTKANMVRNRGSALVISLIILLLMTLIGITSMNTSIMEERMAGNMHNRNLAFQAAESALRKGEAWIAAQTTLPDVSTDGSSGIWKVGAPDPDLGLVNNLAWWQESTRDGSWWTSNAVANSGADRILDADGNDTVVAAQPAYVIEELPPVSGSLEAGLPVDNKDIYLQVTSRGVGGDGTAVVLLQSTYKW